MKKVILIKAQGAVSPLGHDAHTLQQSYQSESANFRLSNGCPVGSLLPAAEKLLQEIYQSNPIYKGIDRSVLMAIYVARRVVADACWLDSESIAINIGSSRGATALFEQYISMYNQTGTVAVNTSPVTTLGNISSWVGQDLNAAGPVISHSTTCSTGIQAIANGLAWLRSGMATRFLAGASEAPLTPFTLSQMKVLGIYSDDTQSPFPCKPLAFGKKNTFVLGEGAAIFALEQVTEDELKSGSNSPIIVESVGFGFEKIGSKTGVSRNGYHFQQAMKNALDNAPDKSAIDLILLHAPGTVAGDLAELNAVREVFSPSEMPVLIAPKWMYGHTLGASACLALHHAIHILETQSFPGFPYEAVVQSTKPLNINSIMINAAGFGGNAASLIVRRYKQPPV